jgi:hypothetical protein
MRTISIIRPPDRSPIDTQFYGWTRSPLCLCHESTSTRYLHETHCLYLQEKFKSVHVPKNCILHPRTTPSSPPSPSPLQILPRLLTSPTPPNHLPDRPLLNLPRILIPLLHRLLNPYLNIPLFHPVPLQIPRHIQFLQQQV